MSHSAFIAEVADSLDHIAKNVEQTRFTLSTFPISEQYNRELSSYMQTVVGKLTEFSAELKRLGL